ncbi:hypothetical protein ACWC9U_26600 [Streptomyces sp. 900116325]
MSNPTTCPVVFEDGERCIRPVHTRSWCRTCYSWSRKHGGANPNGRRPRRSKGKLEAELRVAASATTDECVILTGYAQRPAVKIAGRFPSTAAIGQNAARVVWIIAYGDPGPDQHVLHRCNGGSGESGCISIRHLYLGDHHENMRPVAASAQNRRNHENVRGEGHGMAILTEDEVREIRRRYVPGHRFRKGNRQALVEEFGVSEAAIKDVVTRRRWAHIE